ncbi:hypothetical protein O9992_02675 [Vibrio lentus]|nr:hypothetical protein [Vibrio lentus]
MNGFPYGNSEYDELVLRGDPIWATESMGGMGTDSRASNAFELPFP